MKTRTDWSARLVRAAMRENNVKRSYLIVNPLQGKHVPVSPRDAFGVFDALTAQVQQAVGPAEPVLVIAFAETATAIGAALAVGLGNPTYLMQTTREDVPDTDYLYFSESHSHATEQRLALRGLSGVFGAVRHVVFAEDEVTTGNTIRHLIDALRGAGLGGVRFHIASLLNGMTPALRAGFEAEGIGLHCLCPTDNAAIADSIGAFAYDGAVHAAQTAPGLTPRRLTVPGLQNPRCVLDAAGYAAACAKLAQAACAAIPADGARVLVLGTEECMYPGLCAARMLEAAGRTVRFHATTRSPIRVSTEAAYPLHVRWELRSLYDGARVTYLYNLEPCDHVLVVTDVQPDAAGLDPLLHALAQAVCRDVTILEWRDA